MTANFRAVAGTSGFIPPGAIFKFIQTGGLVNFNGEFRTVALIGTGAVNLPKLAEPVSRGAKVNTVDQLLESTANEIELIGNFAGLRSFLEHRPGVRVLKGDEASDFSDKVEVEFLQTGAVSEDYIITVERIGGPGDISDPAAGAYSITTVSTGETSIWYAVNAEYGNLQAIPGVNLKVTTTVGEQLGNTAKVRVIADPTEGDYLFDKESGGLIDWSPNVGDNVFGQRVGIPVQLSTADAFDIVGTDNKIIPYDRQAHGNLTTQADTLVQPDFVVDGLDNATYKFYAINTTQYQVDKVKNGVVFSQISGFEHVGVSSAPLNVFESNEPYIIDGMLVNLAVTAATNAMEVRTYSSIARPLTQKKDGMKSMEDMVTIFPRQGESAESDTYTLRVFKSDNALTGVSSGSYTLTSELTEITTAPISVKIAQNVAAVRGCSLLVPSTRIKDENMVGWNLVLNSSLEGGPRTAPHNWKLGNLAEVVELTSATKIHGNKALLLPANTNVGDGPTASTFKFVNSNSLRPAKISWYAKSTDGASAGVGLGVYAKIDFIGASGISVGNTTVGAHTFTGVAERFISAAFDIPAGTIEAKITFYNDAASNVYIDAIQMEQTDASAVLDYHESDVVVIRTTEHRVPKEPLPVIAAHMVLPEDKQKMLELITLEPIQGTKRVSSDWIFKKVSADQYTVTRASTGQVFGPFDVDIRYTNIIPGTAVQVKSEMTVGVDIINWLDFADGTIAISSTLSGINVGNTLPVRQYFVNYRFRRPVEEFYTVKAFLQIPDLLADLGEPSTANSLCLGGLIAFQNGATIVQTVQVDEDVNWDLALENLSKVYTNIVVPMLTVDVVEGGDGSGFPTDSQYERATQINFQLLDHATLMSRPLEKKERIIVSSQLPARDLILYGAEAQAANNERLVLVAPTSVIKDVKNPNTGFNDPVVLEGCYLAAAVAGLACRFDVAEPWLRKSLFGFRGLGQPMTDSEVNFLGASGVLVVGTRRTTNPLDSRVAASNVAGQNGALVVSIATTTCTVGSIDQVEPSVVQIKDFVGRTVRNILDELYIGQKNIPEQRSNIEGTTRNILTSMRQSQIITDFRGLTVTTDPVEPRAVNVSFEIAPVFPINYILITFSLIPTASPNSNLLR